MATEPFRNSGREVATPYQSSNPNETISGRPLNQGGNLGEGETITEEDVALYRLYSRLYRCIPELLIRRNEGIINQGDMDICKIYTLIYRLAPKLFRENDIKELYRRMPELLGENKKNKDI